MLFFSFISADKSVGANGFKAVWTEIADPSGPCSEFHCTKSQFCIADKLRCNKVNNCGADDNSDEENCKLLFSGEKVKNGVTKINKTKSNIIMLGIKNQITVICLGQKARIY